MHQVASSEQAPGKARHILMAAADSFIDAVVTDHSTPHKAEAWLRRRESGRLSQFPTYRVKRERRLTTRGLCAEKCTTTDLRRLTETVPMSSSASPSAPGYPLTNEFGFPYCHSVDPIEPRLPPVLVGRDYCNRQRDLVAPVVSPATQMH